MTRPTWKLKEVTGYTAECPHCGADLLADHEFVSWAQPEGVVESLDEDFCSKCDKPITERGYELQEEEAEDTA